jgi:mycoredoxin-dependent peroxiredoxin
VSEVVAVGAEAPDFELRDNNAQTHRLSSYRGKKNVVLVFYPFAFTGVCTGEMVAIRDEIESLQNDDTQVFAISCDTVASLRVFAEQESLTYPLLSDYWPHGEVAKAYGVFNDTLGAADRGTFVIDMAGIVRWTVRNAIRDARDIADYEKALAEL